MNRKHALVLMISLLSACGGVSTPSAATPAPAGPPTAPAIDLAAVQTQAAESVFATLTASAQTVAVGQEATQEPATAVAVVNSPTSTVHVLSSPTAARPTATLTLAPPTPTPPRLLSANLGGGGNLVGRLLYPDTGGAEPTYTTQMYFEVRANDPKAGNSNGAGITNAVFNITDSNGNTVYLHTENAAPYCSFRDTNAVCNVFVFASNGYKWPDSDQKIQGVDLRLHNAGYELDVTVNGKNGDQLSGTLQFNIQCKGCPS